MYAFSKGVGNMMVRN